MEINKKFLKYIYGFVLLSIVTSGELKHEYIKRERVSTDSENGLDIIYRVETDRTVSENCSTKQTALVLKEGLTCVNDTDIKEKLPAGKCYIKFIN